jgi:hypothetical protein
MEFCQYGCSWECEHRRREGAGHMQAGKPEEMDKHTTVPKCVCGTGHRCKAHRLMPPACTCGMDTPCPVQSHQRQTDQDDWGWGMVAHPARILFDNNIPIRSRLTVQGDIDAARLTPLPIPLHDPEPDVVPPSTPVLTNAMIDAALNSIAADSVAHRLGLVVGVDCVMSDDMFVVAQRESDGVIRILGSFVLDGTGIPRKLAENGKPEDVVRYLQNTRGRG